MKTILCSTSDAIRERWRSFLRNQGHSVYQASSPQVLQSLARDDDDYLLLVHQPFLEPQELAVLCRRPGCRVFVLSDTPGTGEGMDFLLKGAVGYANTYVSEGRLAEAVRSIEAGRVWFSQEILSRFIQAAGANKKPGASAEAEKILAPLTEREREIALLVAQGLSNRDIGERLYVSERTVKSHLSSIFTKTGAQSRLKLALLLNG
ncbi:MAG: hypothetical protein Kow0089_18250 [Desulfobulbaceae bacterium]